MDRGQSVLSAGSPDHGKNRPMSETRFQINPELALLITGGTSLALLAGAHAFERIGGLAPCPLCLDQREAHWMALAVSIIAFSACRWMKAARVTAAALGVLGLIYLFSTVLAAYHAGVEWKFWPGPPSCSGAGGSAISDPTDLLTQLDTAPIVSCTDAAWRFLGISMAGYNAVISLALVAVTAMAGFRLAGMIREAAIAQSASRT